MSFNGICFIVFIIVMVSAIMGYTIYECAHAPMCTVYECDGMLVTVFHCDHDECMDTHTHDMQEGRVYHGKDMRCIHGDAWV